MKKIPSKNGFTLIEMLIVLAIFGIVAGAASFLMNGTRNKISLEDAQANILSALEKARNQAATGYGNSKTDYGVIIDITANRISPCSCNDPCDPVNCTAIAGQEINLNDSGATIIEPAVNRTIVFTRLSATSSIGTTIRIRNNASGQDATIIVTINGTIEK